ncbi:NAD(P)/FAD-dependent oxidoreductase [Zhihengliuella sp.]|uniref:phytoene desaturase family protein n=1 Tax=Zhihengliuella sp. TaxID=1954483 RepID=UPI002810D950|nr:NAD(P)/FAD-dependent oxidoreductase [Zhihengliuella sp.]
MLPDPGVAPGSAAGLEAAVVGSGPNGLAAAVTLARAGARVTVYEAAPAIGGAARTAVRDVPGVGEVHYDVGSAVHPTALVSEFLAGVGLTERVEFARPEISYAHPLPTGGDTARGRGGTGPGGSGAAAGLAWRDPDRTLAGLAAAAPAEADAYRRIVLPLARRTEDLARLLLHPVLPLPALGPRGRGATTAARLALASAALAVPPLHGALTRRAPVVAAMLAGLRAHLPGGGTGPGAQGAALLLAALAHGQGWAIPRGGSGAITGALAAVLAEAGGRIELGRRIDDRRELPQPLVLFDTAPEAFAAAVPGLPAAVERRLLERRRGPGAAVVHFVTGAPVPWADPRLGAAGTLHLGGGAVELAASERASRSRFPAENPYVLLSQPSVVDPGRAPAGHHVLWTYTHVPPGGPGAEAVRAAVQAQIERHAPGFGATVLDAWVEGPADLEAGNPNLVGGDIAGGAVDTRGLLLRPGFGLRSSLGGAPWRSPAAGVYLCSASTPPGPAVHGMAGHLAARAALADARLLRRADL